MLEVLEFIFASGSRFVGFILLTWLCAIAGAVLMGATACALAALGEGIAGIIKAYRA